MSDLRAQAREWRLFECKADKQMWNLLRACYVYRAFKDGGRMLEETAQRLGVSKEAMKCNGCLDPVEDLWRTVVRARSGLALRKRALGFAMNAPIPKTLRVLDTKDCAKAARGGEKTLGTRSCELKQEMLTTGSRSRIRSGGVAFVAFTYGGSKRLAVNAVSPLVDFKCL